MAKLCYYYHHLIANFSFTLIIIIITWRLFLIFSPSSLSFPSCPFQNFEQRLFESCLRIVSPQILVPAAVAVKAGQGEQGLLRELCADQVVGQDPNKE